MEFYKINTPAKEIFTVKYEDSNFKSFQPASTGYDNELLILKASMEKLEIEASLSQQPGFISSAAHNTETEAIRNAQFEAVERISLSSWWVHKDPILGKVSSRNIEELLDTYFEPNHLFKLHIGFVQPIVPTGFLAVSILENSHEYPYIVLGSSHKESQKEAVFSAFLESIQSWSATQWMRTNNNDFQQPKWDIGELRRRCNDIESSIDIGADKHNKSEWDRDISPFFKDKPTITKKTDKGWVAWIYPPSPTSLHPLDLAKLAKPNKEARVFTPYIW